MTSYFIERAGEINVQMPKYVVERLLLALNDVGRACKGSRVLLLGVAYKPDIADTRETPAFVIWEQLRAFQCEVSYHDPHVATVAADPDRPWLSGEKSRPLDAETLRETDAVIIVTLHKLFDINVLAGFTGPVIDTRNCVPAHLGLNVVKA